MDTDLTTAKAVIQALGGPEAVRVLAGARYTQIVYHWGTVGHFPPRLFEAMTAALTEKGLSAPSSLWRQQKPTDPKQTQHTPA